MKPRSSPRRSTRTQPHATGTDDRTVADPGIHGALHRAWADRAAAANWANAALQLIATLVLGYSVAGFATTPLSRLGQVAHRHRPVLDLLERACS